MFWHHNEVAGPRAGAGACVGPGEQPSPVIARHFPFHPLIVPFPHTHLPSLPSHPSDYIPSPIPASPGWPHRPALWPTALLLSAVRAGRSWWTASSRWHPATNALCVLGRPVCVCVCVCVDQPPEGFLTAHAIVHSGLSIARLLPSSLPRPPPPTPLPSHPSSTANIGLCPLLPPPWCTPPS